MVDDLSRRTFLKTTALAVGGVAGTADVYRDVGQTSLGRETPESQRTGTRSFEAFIVMLEREMPRA